MTIGVSMKEVYGNSPIVPVAVGGLSSLTARANLALETTEAFLPLEPLGRRCIWPGESDLELDAQLRLVGERQGVLLGVYLALFVVSLVVGLAPELGRIQSQVLVRAEGPPLLEARALFDGALSELGGLLTRGSRCESTEAGGEEKGGETHRDGGRVQDMRKDRLQCCASYCFQCFWSSRLALLYSSEGKGTGSESESEQEVSARYTRDGGCRIASKDHDPWIQRCTV